MCFTIKASPTLSPQTHSFSSHYSTFDYIWPIDLSAAMIRHLGRRFLRAAGMPYLVPDGTPLRDGEMNFRRLGSRRGPQRRGSYERSRPYLRDYCTCNPNREYPPSPLYICSTCGRWTDMAQYQYEAQNYFPPAEAADEIPREQPLAQVPYDPCGSEGPHREDFARRDSSATDYTAAARGVLERLQYADHAYAGAFDAGREPPFPPADEQPGYYGGNRAAGYADGAPIPLAEHGRIPGANEQVPMQGQDRQDGARRHASAGGGGLRGGNVGGGGNVRPRNTTTGTERQSSRWETRVVVMGGGRGYLERRRRR